MRQIDVVNTRLWHIMDIMRVPALFCLAFALHAASLPGSTIVFSWITGFSWAFFLLFLVMGIVRFSGRSLEDEVFFEDNRGPFWAFLLGDLIYILAFFVLAIITSVYTGIGSNTGASAGIAFALTIVGLLLEIVTGGFADTVYRRYARVNDFSLTFSRFEWLSRVVAFVFLLVSASAALGTPRPPLFDFHYWVSYFDSMSLALMIFAVLVSILVTTRDAQVHRPSALLSPFLDLFFGGYGALGIVGIGLGLGAGAVVGAAVTAVALFALLGAIMVLWNQIRQADENQGVERVALLVNVVNMLATAVVLVLIIIQPDPENKIILDVVTSGLVIVANTAGIVVVFAAALVAHYKEGIYQTWKEWTLYAQVLAVALLVVAELVKLAGVTRQALDLTSPTNLPPMLDGYATANLSLLGIAIVIFILTFLSEAIRQIAKSYRSRAVPNRPAPQPRAARGCSRLNSYRLPPIVRHRSRLNSYRLPPTARHRSRLNSYRLPPTARLLHRLNSYRTTEPSLIAQVPAP